MSDLSDEHLPDQDRPDQDRPDHDRPDHDRPDEHHVDSRADLLPEERRAGSDNPHEQAEVILEESAERTDDPGATGAESVQTSTPDERPD